MKMGMSNNINENQSILIRLNNIENRIRNLEKNNGISTEEKTIPNDINLILKNFENRITILENNQKIDNRDKYSNNTRPLTKYDFIRKINKNDIKTQYFEPYEIKKQNEMIVGFIKENVFKYYMKEDLNKTSGEFLYLVGKISRFSVGVSNEIYKDLFKEYKAYLKSNNYSLEFNQEKDRRNFSIWIKNVLSEQECFQYYSQLYENQIINYIDKFDTCTKNILIKIFNNLISLYTKCMLSFPLVTIKFIGSGSDFKPEIMLDIILKYGRSRKVNFCFLPGLISNGKNINNGYYYVFTYTSKTYKIEGNPFENENPVQNIALYSIPNYDELKINYKKKQINDKFYKITINEEPIINTELMPRFYLYENGKLISEDQNKEIMIDKKYIKNNLVLLIKDKIDRNKRLNINFNH